jgi:microcystin-dependent protein
MGKFDLSNNFTINTDKFIVDSFGNTTLMGNLDLSNNFTINTDQFIVDNTGNIKASGNLDISKNFTINTDKFIVDELGNITSTGNLDLSNNFRINTDKFIVDNYGNIKATGDLDLSHNLRINTDNFVVDNSGNIKAMGDFDLSQNLRINTDRFIVDSLGNTSLMGDLNINSNKIIADVNGNIKSAGSIDLSQNLRVNTNKFIVDSLGNTCMAGTLDVSGNLNVNTDKFTVVASNGNTNVAGTLTVASDFNVNNILTVVADSESDSGFTTLSGALWINNGNFYINNDVTTVFSVDNVTGRVEVSGELSANGDLYIGIDKFIVYADTGNTSVAGTLDVLSNLNVNTDKFIVDAVTGNTGMTGTLDISGNFVVNSDKFIVESYSGNTLIAGTLNVTDDFTVAEMFTVNINDNSTEVYGELYADGNFYVAEDKFIVNAASGDTSIAGVLDVFGNLNVNTNKFTVDNLGNIKAMGRFDLSNNFTVNTNKFIVDNIGNIKATGNFDLSQNLRINTDKFTVDNNGNIKAMGNLDISNNFTINTNKFIVDNIGNIKAIGNFDLSNNLRINTDKFTVDNTGNIKAMGNLDISNNFSVNQNQFIVDNSGNLMLAGSIKVNNTKFIVDSLGNLSINDYFTVNDQRTIIGKELDLSSNLYINNNIFTVNANTGNTTIAGKLDISKNIIVNTNKCVIDANTGTITTLGGLNTIDDIIVNTNKFTVAGLTGNTNIGGNLNILQNLKINTNRFMVSNTGKTDISGNLTVSNTLFVDVSNNKIGVNTYNPKYDLDVSGNVNLLNIKSSKIGTNGYIKNPEYIILSNYLIDYSAANNDNDEITLTYNNYSNQNTVLEYDITSYNIPDIIKLDFDIIIENNNIGNGFWVSFYNETSYKTTTNYKYDQNLNGYVLFFSIYDSLIYLNNTSIASLPSLLSNNNISLTIINNKTNINLLLYLNNNLITNYEINNSPLSSQRLANYLVIGGSNRAGISTITQKVKNVKIYIQNYTPNKELEILGDGFISGDLNVDGKIYIKSDISVNNIYSQKIGTNGYLINMPNTYDTSFKYDIYNVNNGYSYIYDTINLTDENIPSCKTVMQFDMTNITNILTDCIFSFNILLNKTNNINNTGIGFWISLYNTSSYNNNNVSYDSTLGGASLFFNIYSNIIELYINGSLITSQNTHNLKTLITNTEYLVQVIIYNNKYIQVLIDNIQYFGYETILTYGPYFGIGAINGAVNITLTQSIKNIKLYNKKLLSNDNSLSIYGDTLLHGAVNIEGVLNTNSNMNINNLLYVDTSNNNIGIGTTIPAHKLHVLGDVLIDGNIITSGSLASESQSIEKLIITNNTTGPAMSINQIYSGGGILNIEENNTSVFTILNGGFIGIGTSQPVSTLHIVGTYTDISSNLRVGGDLNVDKNILLSGDFNINTNKFNVDPVGNVYIDGNLSTLNNSLYVDSINNNVGIGTSNPNSKLHVLGNMRIEGDLLVNGSQIIINTETQTSEQLILTNNGTGPAIVINQLGDEPIIDFKDDNVSVFFINNGGYVGICNTNPIEKLDISGNALVRNKLFVGNSSINNSNDTITLYDTSNTSIRLVSNVNNSSIKFEDISNNSCSVNMNNNGFNLYSYNNLNFFTNSVQKILISTDIYLTPTSKLDVSGNVNIKNNLLMNNNQTLDKNNNLTVNSALISSGNLIVENTGNINLSNGSLYVIGSNKYVGINKTPNYTLDISGNINFNNNLYQNGSKYIDASPWTLYDSNGNICTNDNVNNGKLTYNNGNVGIGLTTPIEKLHIRNNSVLIEDNSSNMFLKLGIINNSACIMSGMSNTNNSAAPLLFTTINNKTEWMRIDANGRVGIGETIPSAYLSIKSNANYDLVNINSFIYVSNNNKLGIGTSTPSGWLDISNNTFDTSLKIKNTIGPLLDIQNQTDNVAYITNLGKVGIGITTPGSKVDILDNSNTYGLKVTQKGAGDILWLLNDTSTNMIVKKSGNVGIGTTNPDANIHINYIGGKKIQFTNDSTTNQHIVLWEDTGYTGFGADSNSLKYYVRNNVNSHVFYSGTSSSELLRIQGDGNVGIGITNPQYKLDISANDKVLLNLYQGGSNNIITANNFTINNDGKLGLNVIPVARLDISENNTNTALKITQNGSGNVLDLNSIITVSNNGNIGINKSSPLYHLDISCNNNIGLNIVQNSNKDILRFTSITSNLTVNNSCYVGIGVTNPLTTLSITATSYSSKITLYDNNDNTKHMGFGVTNNQLNYHSIKDHVFYNGGKNADGIENMRLDASGNLGIGVSNPTAKLDISNNINQNVLKLNNNQVIVDNHGKIGIGKQPSYTLDVSGNIYTNAKLGINVNPTYQIDVIGDINVTGGYRINGNQMVDAIPVGTVISYTNEVLPSGWLKCDGSELLQTDYPDLFAVVGTKYGGSTTTFKLPDMRSRTIVGSGQNVNCTNRTIGDTGGSETHSLTVDEIPSHSHRVFNSQSTSALEYSATNKKDILIGDRGGQYEQTNTDNTDYIESTGGSQPHSIMSPFIVCNYIIKALPIISMFGTPFNHWTRTNNNITFTAGNVGIGITNPIATLHVQGTITATGTKNFTIEHPVKMNHKLIHACIEGPRADLIYRGKIKLCFGKATVDICKECNITGGLTPGTLNRLGKNPDIFLQNNETFDRVIGRLEDEFLYITCENTTSFATISWMIVIERNDIDSLVCEIEEK